MKIRNLVLSLGAAAVIAGGGLFAFSSHTLSAPASSSSTPDIVSPAAGDAKDAHAEMPATVDVKKALADRALGDPAAPVKLEEFASLTCSHCAEFAKTSFDKIKEQYIDTGKVYFIYHDFPLNAPALDAAAIARCLPEERYFSFVKFLFETQDKWAFIQNPRDVLRQNSKLVGMSDQLFDACVNNQDLRQGLADQMKAVSDKHKIEATPTFVINDTEVIRGAMPLEEFIKKLDQFATKNGKP